MLFLGTIILNKNCMTKKDFFRIIIKLFGLYWLINTIFSLSQVFYFTTNFNSDGTEILFSIFVLLFAVAVFALLILGADKIISWLKLDKGYDDDKFEIYQFNVELILILAMVLIGGMLILDNIPIFINQAYMAFKSQVSYEGDIMALNGYSTYNLAISFTKIILGYLLIKNYNVVGKFLLKTRQNKD
jgi:hypothetical protein